VLHNPAMSAIDYAPFEVLTFDCYGTLIDWESGIVTAMTAALGEHPRDELLELYGRHEHEVEVPYRVYREVLAETLRRVGRELGIEVGDEEAAAFGASVGDWPAFPDSADALQRLQSKFRLAVITNCDDDLFALSERRLAVRFDDVITAEQVRSYKPDPANFHYARDKIGVPQDRILHVAQSLFHDHVPAKALGMTTVWINRRAAQGGGGGATPPAHVHPDATFPDMASFAADAGV
jgi:2-haloacid dehalogenase